MSLPVYKRLASYTSSLAELVKEKFVFTTVAVADLWLSLAQEFSMLNSVCRPRPGSSGGCPRRRPHSLWAACASALSLHSTEVLLVFRGKIRWLWYPAVLIAEQKVKGRAVLGPEYRTRGTEVQLSVADRGVDTAQPAFPSR